MNSRGFQKMLAYRRLAEGIDILEEEDQIFESMINSITKQHSQVRSEGSTREFFKLFREEIKAHTDPLVGDDQEDSLAEDIENLMVEEDG